MTPSPAGTPSPERWAQIEATLQRALDVAPLDRDAWLADACAGDPELRREVESLLAAEPGTRFLERAVLPELRPPTAPQRVIVPDHLPRGDSDNVAARLAAALADRYAVERELGRGGMAMVFLARDLRHRRPVAIKALYPELSAVLGPDRFLQEIELTASLQHPHILPLYDSGTADGLLFYVMPFVEGETLRARLTRERHLPVGDALRIATEVADALTYAHARHVVHRDIKPENILLQGGHAVVADFGIALAVQQAGGERMTRTGLSLGTPHYMAPEQAMGDRVVDARADVYALGAVTYEMLAGEAPFTGPSAQAVVARVLTESPPALAPRRPHVPPHVEAAIRMAMEKIPADRFPTAAALADALADSTRVACAPRRPSSDRQPASDARSLLVTKRAAVLLVAGALVAVGLGASAGWLRGRAQGAAPIASTATGVMRFAIDADSGAGGLGAPALAPDGATVVYAGQSAKGTTLFARRLDELAARPIGGTDNAEMPFFSPDGSSIAYAMKGAIWTLRLDGGTPELIAWLPEGQRFAGGTWGADDLIIYGVDDGGLYRTSARGGDASRLAGVDSELPLLQPQLLPGQRALLVTVAQDDDAGRIGIVDLSTGALREIGAGAGARYAADHIVFARPGGAIFRQRFDVALLQPTGDPVRIERSLDAGASTAHQLATLFDVARDGTIAYRTADAAAEADATRLVLADRAGRVLQEIASRVPWAPRFSPDGRRVAFGAFAGGRDASDVWITDLATRATQPLTIDGQDNNDPQWSPDGESIAYSSLADGGKDLFIQPIADVRPRRLTSAAGSEWPSGWSSDGKQVVFTHWQSSGQRDIWLQPADGGAPRPLVAGSAQETGASISPDGRWLLYQSDESGLPEIYITAFPTPGPTVRVSPGGGVNPRWRADGREVYYWQDDRLIAVPVQQPSAGAPLALGVRLTLFRAAYTPRELPMYDVSPDGSRIVLVTQATRTERLVVAVGLLGSAGV